MREGHGGVRGAMDLFEVVDGAWEGGGEVVVGREGGREEERGEKEERGERGEERRKKKKKERKKKKKREKRKGEKETWMIRNHQKFCNRQKKRRMRNNNSLWLRS